MLKLALNQLKNLLPSHFYCQEINFQCIGTNFNCIVNIPIGKKGDCFDRYLVRIEEMRESVDIINQCIMLEVEGIFHFGTYDVLSRYDFAHKIANAFSLNRELIIPIKSSDLLQTANRPMKTNLICSKIKHMLDVDLETLTSIFDNKANYVE